MGEKYGLTKAFVLEEIENYGIKGRALQTIKILVNESGLARSLEEFELLVLECCAAWSGMVNFYSIRKGVNDLNAVVKKVLKDNLEDRLDLFRIEIEEGIYVEENNSNEYPGYYIEEYNVKRKKRKLK